MSAKRDDEVRRAKAPRSPAFETKRQQLAVLVASGRTVVSAAREVGVNVRTAERWLKEPHVAAAVKANIVSTVEAAKKRLLSLAEPAAECLGNAIADGDRVAAVAVLDRVGIGPQLDVAHSGSIAIGQMTDEQLRAELDRVRAELAKGGGT